jgi:hypothetical protein
MIDQYLDTYRNVQAGSSKQSSGRSRDQDSEHEEIIQIQHYEKRSFEDLMDSSSIAQMICITFDCDLSSVEEFCRKGWIKMDHKLNLPHLDQRMLDLYPEYVQKRWELVLENEVEIRAEGKVKESTGERQ